jgi:hypothetical protein
LIACCDNIAAPWVDWSDIHIRIAAIHIPGSSLLLGDIINLILESLKRSIAGNGIETNAINVFKRNGLRAA